MKEDWVVKKLGDVCTIERGGSPRPINAYLTDSADGINWIKIGDASEGSKYITSTKERIKPEGVKKSRMVHKGDFILSNSMSFGRPYILNIDGCIHDGWLVIHDKNNVFDKSYLYYYLGSPNIYREFQRLAVGGVVNNLNSELVRNVQVAIPPLPEQSRIVEELDQLSNIIEKKRQQLSELDNLAQSIFYDMFILKNEQWERMPLIDIYKFIDYRGKTPNKIDYGVPLITARNIRKGYIDYTVKEFISETEFQSRQSRGIAQKGDLLFTTEAPMGYAAIADLDTFSTGQRLITFQQRNEGVVSNIYVLYYILSDMFQTELNKQATGATVKGIKGSKLEKMIVPLPPFNLQQLFAQKIEAIEKEKELIKQSIKETEELFNSRMDYYFG